MKQAFKVHFVVKLSMFFFLSKWRRNSLSVFQMLSISNGAPKLNGASIHYVELLIKLRCRHFYSNQIIHVFYWNTYKVLPNLDRVCSWIGLKMRFMLCMFFSLCSWTKNLQQAIFFIERHFGISFQKEQRDYYMLWQASILCIKNLNTDTSKILYIDFIWFGGLAHMIKVKFNLNSTFLNVLAYLRCYSCFQKMHSYIYTDVFCIYMYKQMLCVYSYTQYVHKTDFIEQILHEMTKRNDDYFKKISVLFAKVLLQW